MTKKLIYLEDALDALAEESYHNEEDYRTAVKAIGGLPSAQPEACDDAISRDDAIMAVKTGALSAATIFGRTDEGATAYYETVKAIKALPSAQPERKRGKWIYSEDEYGIDGYHCDKCGFFVPWDYAHKLINYIEDYHYCPNCGHPMGGDDGFRCQSNIGINNQMPLPEPYGGESK